MLSLFLPSNPYLYLFSATLLWAVVFGLFLFFFKEKRLSYQLTALSYYALVPLSLFGYQCAHLFQPQPMITSIHRHFLLITVSYYVFSLLCELRLPSSRLRWDIIAHHVVFGGVMFFFGTGPDFPAYWMWLPVLQVSTVVVSLRAVVKIYPKRFERYDLQLQQLDFRSFFFFRILLQTVLMAYILVQEFEKGEASYVLLFCGFLASMVFNLFWFRQLILRKRRLTVGVKKSF